MKDFDIYLTERLKEYDLLVKERRSEHAILLKERLTECDILIESLLYRELISAEDYMLLESCVERYRILKYVAASIDTELCERIDATLARCYMALSENAVPEQELLGTATRNYASTETDIEPSADVVAITANLFNAADAGVALSAELLDIDAHTRFDGVEMAITPSAEYIDSARKFLRAENALFADMAVRDTMSVFTSVDAPNVAVSAELLGAALVKLRYVSELDTKNISELDGTSLSGLDYIIIDD